MAKRLTGTDKWDREWFMKLPPRLKCFWQYLNDKCDQAGVWEVNYTLASIFIGETISDSDLIHFGNRLEKFAPGKIWIVDHVDFQCGDLSERCPAHKPVFKLLKKHSLLDRVLNRVYNTQQEKEIEKEEEKEGEKDKGVQGESTVQFTDTWFKSVFDEILMESIRSTFPKHDLQNELSIFKLKVRGSPDDYRTRDTGGIRQAFIYQLKNSKATNGNRTGNTGTVRRADATIEQPTSYGKF